MSQGWNQNNEIKYIERTEAAIKKQNQEDFNYPRLEIPDSRVEFQCRPWSTAQQIKAQEANVWQKERY